MSDQPSTPLPEISCDQCREWLSDYVDRELSAGQLQAVERHLSNCVKCGTESACLLGLKKIIQHWDGVGGSGEFRQSVMQQMIRESHAFPSAAATAAADQQQAVEDEAEAKSLPPVWVLLAAIALAVAAYYIVLFVRGL